MTDIELELIMDNAIAITMQLSKQRDQFKSEHPIYEDNHVFDENQTVLWNREQVKKKNASTRGTLASFQSRISAQHKRIHDAFVEYAKDEFDLPKDVAVLVYRYAYENGHSEGYNNVKHHMAHYAEFAQQVIDAITP